VVQRTPEFVDQTDPALTGGSAALPTGGDTGASPGNAAPLSTVNTTNQELGRRFRIVQFRWLNADEV
jgi:hypothetical protein